MERSEIPFSVPRGGVKPWRVGGPSESLTGRWGEGKTIAGPESQRPVGVDVEGGDLGRVRRPSQRGPDESGLVVEREGFDHPRTPTVEPKVENFGDKHPDPRRGPLLSPPFPCSSFNTPCPSGRRSETRSRPPPALPGCTTILDPSLPQYPSSSAPKTPESPCSLRHRRPFDSGELPRHHDQLLQGPD